MLHDTSSRRKSLDASGAPRRCGPGHRFASACGERLCNQKDWPPTPCSRRAVQWWPMDFGCRRPPEPAPTAWASPAGQWAQRQRHASTTTEGTTLRDGTRVLSISASMRADRISTSQMRSLRPMARAGSSKPPRHPDDRDGETGKVLSRTTFSPTEPRQRAICANNVQPPLCRSPSGLRSKPSKRRGRSSLPFRCHTSPLGAEGRIRDGIGFDSARICPRRSVLRKMTALVGQLSQQQLDSACPRNGEVRAITNDVTRTVRTSGQYRTGLNRQQGAYRNSQRSSKAKEIRIFALSWC